jgi:hypothetical protein
VAREVGWDRLPPDASTPRRLDASTELNPAITEVNADLPNEDVTVSVQKARVASRSPSPRPQARQLRYAPAGRRLHDHHLCRRHGRDRLEQRPPGTARD